MNVGMHGFPVRSPTVYEHIETVLTQALQSRVVFSRMSRKYRSFLIRALVRSTASANSVILRLQLNEDAGSSSYVYMRQNRFGNANGAAAFLELGTANAANATAGAFSIFTAELMGCYDPRMLTSVMSTSTSWDGTLSSNVITHDMAGWWNSTADVHTLALSLASGVFADGSEVSLYGVA